MSRTSPVFKADPVPLAEILRRAKSRMMESWPLAVGGVVGITLGLICFAVLAARHGVPIPPEGDLTKSGSFDTAVGIYLLTLTLLLPSAGFTDRGRKRWVRWNIALFTYGYTIETVQIFRGLDPRFSKVGSPTDRILGLVFFVTALSIMTLFIIMAVKFFRRGRPDAESPVLLAIRYGCVTAIGAFAAGIWMSLIGGRHTGEAGNILPLHALGFHGLQAVPVVALLLTWGGANEDETRKWVHITGIAWVIACAAVAQQTIAGRSIFDVSPALLVSGFVLVVWTAMVVFAFWRWAQGVRGVVTNPVPREAGGS